MNISNSNAKLCLFKKHRYQTEKVKSKSKSSCNWKWLCLSWRRDPAPREADGHFLNYTEYKTRTLCSEHGRSPLENPTSLCC